MLMLFDRLSEALLTLLWLAADLTLAAITDGCHGSSTAQSEMVLEPFSQ